MTFDEWWNKHRANCEFSSAFSKCVARFWEQESWNAALQSHNSAMDAIKAVCERTDPHETDIEVLRVAVNKIYAALTMHHGANVG